MMLKIPLGWPIFKEPKMPSCSQHGNKFCPWNKFMLWLKWPSNCPHNIAKNLQQDRVSGLSLDVRDKSIPAYSQNACMTDIGQLKGSDTSTCVGLGIPAWGLPVTAGRKIDGFMHPPPALYFSAHASKDGWSTWILEQIEGCHYL